MTQLRASIVSMNLLAICLIATRAFVVLVLGGCIFVVGCSDTKSAPADQAVSWNGVSSMQSQEPLDALRRVADDRSLSSRERAVAIYKIFANHLKPPKDSKTVSKEIGQATWLSDARIKFIRAMGGGWPRGLEEFNGLPRFECVLFPDNSGRSDWFIIFALSGLKPPKTGTDEEFEKNARAFFKGEAGFPVSLPYFILHFPGSRLEVFCKKGITVINMAPGK
jgi:hypothetical protein